jgi:UDP-N-acetylmuramoyl-tripeptide--D-alanyl-D-alanine ligase
MYALPIPLLLAKWFIVMPKEAQLIAESEKILAGHPGIKIAVAGSYGKTTMKELLSTVLGESKKVAATPANKNVAISHAVFAKHLQGDEEFVIIEYGEGAPGDVARFAHNTHPDYGVITGLAPAHLDHYKTLEAAGKDIFSLATYLNDTHVYVNDMAPSVKPFLKKQYELFDTEHAMGWKISDIKIAMEGTDFTIRKAKMNLVLHSNLLGRHQVAYLAFVAAFGLEHGMTEKAVATGIADTRPFEHRMQPYRVAGAWVIDDTYNGNLEGIRAGTALLSELEAKRKVYITPGLVDQGRQTERIHVEVGELIANAKPDLVVLMKNSVSAFIEKGLRNAGFKGTLQLEYNPLEFYTNLDQFVAAGDIVMMQNDWPDNYA